MDFDFAGVTIECRRPGCQWRFAGPREAYALEAAWRLHIHANCPWTADSATVKPMSQSERWRLMRLCSICGSAGAAVVERAVPNGSEIAWDVTRDSLCRKCRPKTIVLGKRENAPKYIRQFTLAPKTVTLADALRSLNEHGLEVHSVHREAFLVRVPAERSRNLPDGLYDRR